MTRLFLILSTLIFSTLFLFYNPQGEIGFVFSDYKVPTQTYYYFLFEHLILVILAYVIFLLEPMYKIAAATFIAIQIVDTLDYILTYGEPWFDSRVFTWNTIKVGAFSLAMIYEKYGRNTESK